MEELILEAETRKHNNEQQEQSLGLFGLKRKTCHWANEKSQEAISISSDSENETKSEPKKSDKEPWKFRLPKKSSKYIPETRKDVECKDNDLWLSKRYPAEFEKNALAIKSFRDDMMSKDTYILKKE